MMRLKIAVYQRRDIGEFTYKTTFSYSRFFQIRKCLKAVVSIAICLISLCGHAQTNLPVFQTIESLKDSSADLANFTSDILLEGYEKSGDGGGGFFLWLSSDERPPDNVIVFKAGRNSKGRWIRQNWNGLLTPEMAGAIGDGQTDDTPAFDRLVKASLTFGAYTIRLTPGKHYFFSSILDLSVGAPGLMVAGPSSPRYDVPSGQLPAPSTRIEMSAVKGAYIKLGSAQKLENLLIVRHGLPDAPSNLAQVRSEVTKWFSEDGNAKPLSMAVFAPFDDAVVEGSRIIGFHTGIQLRGGRFAIKDTQIDTAGYAIDVSRSKATSIIENVSAGSLWSRPAEGHDNLGDSGYRPGTAYYVHESADGLQINSVSAEGWVNGIWLAGTPEATDWLISIFQPDIETPANDGDWTAGIKTSGEIRRVTIIDPRIVSGGGSKGGSASLDFGHNSYDPVGSRNNNVTVIGGTLEVAGAVGSAIVIRKGSTGMLLGTTMNMAIGQKDGPLVRVLAGSGRWLFSNPDLRGTHGAPWMVIAPGSVPQIQVIGENR